MVSEVSRIRFVHLKLQKQLKLNPFKDKTPNTRKPVNGLGRKIHTLQVGELSHSSPRSELSSGKMFSADKR